MLSSKFNGMLLLEILKSDELNLKKENLMEKRENFEGVAHPLPLETDKVCMNCFQILSKKQPQSVYIYTNHRGKFCSKICAKQYEEKKH